MAAIDPGVTSGCVFVREDGGSIVSAERRQIVHGPALMRWLYGLPKLDLCIVEDYIGSGHRTRYTIHTLRVIGAIEGWAWHRDQSLTFRAPQKRKAFVKQARTILNVRHSNRHAADALAHIMSWLHQETK